MKTEDCKILTEYLGDCWHDLAGFGYPIRDDWFALKKSYTHPPKYNRCIHCGKSARFLRDNRTFTTRADMMDLYDRLFQKHKWHKFTVFAKMRFSFNDYDQTFTNIETGFYAWIFCLNGDGYEDRCQMVAEWIKEGK